jgi:uncharacterized protein with HEPN domain
MPSKSPDLALIEIAHNIALARNFIAGLSFADFQADARTLYAVTRCLEIISEASRRLPVSLKQRHPNINWSEIAAAGSVYRHDYEQVQDRIIWKTVNDSLEPLLAAVHREIQGPIDA